MPLMNRVWRFIILSGEMDIYLPFLSLFVTQHVVVTI